MDPRSSPLGAASDAGGDEFYLVARSGDETRVVPVGVGDTVTIGRAPSATLVVDDARASRDHARIERRDAALVVRDLGSRNGTWVRGEKVVGAERALEGGDVVSVGPLSIVVAASARHARHATSAAAANDDDAGESFIVADPSMVKVFAIVRRLAATTTTVLVLGETGVGKEVVAEQLHRWSARHDKPFVSLSCAALPEALAEAELFGHEKGAFTGADRRKIGFLEAAHGGTLMLDEVGELTPPLQAKLLRVLETRRLTRVGSTQEIPIDVRVVSATCKDLKAACDAGTFRQDLFFRLSAFTLEVPPLRERPQEIVLLADLFSRQLALGGREPKKSLAADAVEALTRYAWPGNVRELKNAIEHAHVLATGPTIAREHLPPTVRASPSSPSAAASPTSQMVDRVADVEKKTITEALAACGGNRTKAAMRLGISRRTLVYKLAKHGIR